MSRSDGKILGSTKLVDAGPRGHWNLVILSEGYRQSEMSQFERDAQRVVEEILDTQPIDELTGAINVYRIDVASTDSGADDPVCGEQGGTGEVAATFFDATFCGDGTVRRLLTVDQKIALDVAKEHVADPHAILVLVNTPMDGGSGRGIVGTASSANSTFVSVVHELGHAAFDLADEYEYLIGPDLDGDGQQRHPANVEPTAPNVTVRLSPLKWQDHVETTTAIPTTENQNCEQPDPQSSPVNEDTVGAFEGADHFHCGAFRPEFNCMMRTLGQPFCAVCRRIVRRVLARYIEPLVTSVNPGSGQQGTPVTIVGEDLLRTIDIFFGNEAVKGDFDVVSASELTTKAPRGNGTVDVKVKTPGGLSEASPEARFTYEVASLAPPVVDSIEPVTGQAGTEVTIKGRGFARATGVGFGSTGAAFKTPTAEDQIIATAPEERGTVDVTVEAAGGTSETHEKAQFIYVEAPPAPEDEDRPDLDAAKKFARPVVESVDPAEGGAPKR